MAGEAWAPQWKVERTVAWLGNYRRILIRWERLLGVYEGFMTLVVMVLCVNRLAREGWVYAPGTGARRGGAILVPRDPPGPADDVPTSAWAA